MNKIDNIKFLYDQVIDKKDLIEKVAQEFGVEISTVRTGWIARWEIPKKYQVQERLITFMQTYINLKQ